MNKDDLEYYILREEKQQREIEELRQKLMKEHPEWFPDSARDEEASNGPEV